MPMQTYCPCPRPILKRSPTSYADAQPSSSSSTSSSTSTSLSAIYDANPLLHIDPSILHPLVHFPPHAALARTFAAHSPSIYDRSPIVVAPNKCSLPERGCPGRTYVPVEAQRPAAAYPQRKTTYMRPPPSPSIRNGKHMHPRSNGREVAFAVEDDEDDDTPASAELTPLATPTLYAKSLPALSDGSSSSSSTSSSESDESDGFLVSGPDASTIGTCLLYSLRS